MPDQPSLFDAHLPAEVALPRTERDPGPAATLAQVRAWLIGHRDDGVGCPACGQHVKVYRRSITATSARALVALYRAGGIVDYVHLPTVLARKQADECKMAYWGLIEEAPAHRVDGGRAGWWRVTGKGEAWLRGHITVTRYALVYNGECLGFTGEQIGIGDAMRTDFDLAELLAS